MVIQSPQYLKRCMAVSASLFFVGNSKLPSLFHIAGLKPLCTGCLKDVRETKCPSPYPHILGHIHYHRKIVRARSEKVRET